MGLKEAANPDALQDWRKEERAPLVDKSEQAARRVATGIRLEKRKRSKPFGWRVHKERQSRIELADPPGRWPSAVYSAGTSGRTMNVPTPCPTKRPWSSSRRISATACRLPIFTR